METKEINICTHTHTQMGTKTISIMDDVYKTLVTLKEENESFSDELRRILRKEGDIMKLAGGWKDITKKDAKKIEKTMEELRRGSRLKELK